MGRQTSFQPQGFDDQRREYGGSSVLDTDTLNDIFDRCSIEQWPSQVFLVRCPIDVHIERGIACLYRFSCMHVLALHFG